MFLRLPHLLSVASVLVLAVAVAGCATDEQPAETTAERAPVATAAPTPAEQPTATPIEQLVGQLVMTKLSGPTATAEELAALRGGVVGGVILFGPSVVDAAQLDALTASLRKADPDVLVSVDQEGGSIRNVPFAPPAETQPTLASAPLAEVERVGRETGEGLAAHGVDIDLGPVADLRQSPNFTMAGRSFGEDAKAVAPLVAASVRGLQAGGVAAATKHFPGFGASTENSDNGIAHVDRTRAQLAAEELVPFRAAIEAGTEVVMVSHGIYRGLGSDKPAIIEPKITTDLLRGDLGFDGVAMTDSMNAKGFRDAWGDTVPRACPAAVGAGIDLLLLTGTMETARLCRARILDAVHDGSLPEARVRQAAGRVLELRRRRT